MRIRTAAKEGALTASKPRRGRPDPRLRTRCCQGRGRPAVGDGQGDGRQADAGGGIRWLGLSGRVPHRVDAATKTGLLELLDEGPDALDLLDVDQAAGSAAHSVPRVMAGWLGCSLPPFWAGSSHSVLLAVVRP
jgi:hypothetical protein